MAKTTKKKSSKKSSKKTSRSAAPNASGKELVIVESPAKARTINRYLGDDYVVMASVGHVRDLPSKPPKGEKRKDHPVPGVDIEHDFEPTYEVIQGKGNTVTQLKRAARQARNIWLATDLDREGEAIAWHLVEALGMDVESARRVVFNAITKDEIRRAFDQPRSIDMDKVNAQQARRILDRIVGYQVSPLLWKKVAGGLSAGRVQSVAVRLVVEREREIQAFNPEEYWKVTGFFTTELAKADNFADAFAKWLAEGEKIEKANKQTGRSQKDKQAWMTDHSGFVAELVDINGEKFESRTAEDTLAVARKAGFELLEDKRTEDPKAKGDAKNQVTLIGKVGDAPTYTVESIETKRTRSRPFAPFITSTMQQSAANVLNFAAQTTMRVAQQLYEGVEVPGVGSIGLITYMRTDSTHLSGEAISNVRKYIDGKFGDKYLPEKPNFYSSSNKAAQEAHEAIRPTDVTLSPDSPGIKKALDERQLKLYRLIWNRFVACQMTPAEWDSTSVVIAAEADGTKLRFRGSGRTLVFDGFYKVTGLPKSGDDQILPPLEEKQEVAPIQIDPTQHFTSPPPRYTEASLVKKLESEGIGRPSTYASIIQVIQNRKYVEKISNRFHATDLGMVVTDKLLEAFPGIMEVGYTREMENQLDAVEEQHHDWVQMLHKFYGPFKQKLSEAHEELQHAKAETAPSPYDCPECGAKMEYRFGRNGRFLSCSRYPDCKAALPIDREGRPQPPETTDIACPDCGKAMMMKKGRFGPFLSCQDYPECKGVVNLDKKGAVKLPQPPPYLTDLDCPKCGEKLNLRESKRGLWLSCSAFPKCRGRQAWSKLEEDKQAELESAWSKHRSANPVPDVKTIDGKVLSDEKPYVPQKIGGDQESDTADNDDPSADEQ
jgi:DNA topoisomerase-1